MTIRTPPGHCHHTCITRRCYLSTLYCTLSTMMFLAIESSVILRLRTTRLYTSEWQILMPPVEAWEEKQCPDGGDSKQIWNIGQFLGDYTASTERHGWIVNTPAYLWGPGFKSLSRDRLSWLRFFIISLSLSRQITGEYLKIKSQPLPSKSFASHRSLITLSFDAL
jgi:hypothetical protein